MEGERTCCPNTRMQDLRDEGLGAATGVASAPRRLTHQPPKEEPMGEVYLSLSMSLDGYVTGPSDVEALHRWLFDGENPSPHGNGLRFSEPSRAVIDETLDATGGISHLRFRIRP
jgi:hypothetical protein